MSLDIVPTSVLEKLGFSNSVPSAPFSLSVVLELKFWHMAEDWAKPFMAMICATGIVLAL